LFCIFDWSNPTSCLIDVGRILIVLVRPDAGKVMAMYLDVSISVMRNLNEVVAPSCQPRIDRGRPCFMLGQISSCDLVGGTGGAINVGFEEHIID
jgi:hypothetical protein